MSSFEQHLIENVGKGLINYRIIPRLQPDGQIEFRIISLEDESLQYYRIQGNEIVPFVPDKERID